MVTTIRISTIWLLVIGLCLVVFARLSKGNNDFELEKGEQSSFLVRRRGGLPTGNVDDVVEGPISKSSPVVDNSKSSPKDTPIVDNPKPNHSTNPIVDDSSVDTVSDKHNSKSSPVDTVNTSIVNNQPDSKHPKSTPVDT
ncbi:12782_t:CDS:1, partial [Cetraspora pellucida]